MNYRVVSEAEQRRLYDAAKAGSAEAQNALAESVLPWAIVYAQRFVHVAHLTQEDVTSCAGMGIAIALQTWRPEKGALASYVRRPIRWEALKIGFDRGHVLQHGKRKKRVKALSVGDGFHIRHHTCEQPGPAARTETANSLSRMHTLIRTLPGRLEHILRLYYFESQTLQTIGDTLGISRERVRQLKARALGQLREKMEHQEPPDVA